MGGFFDGFLNGVQSPLFLGGANLLMGGGPQGMMEGMRTGAAFQDRQRRQQQEEQAKQSLTGVLGTMGLKPEEQQFMLANPETALGVLQGIYKDRFDPMAGLRKQQMEANIAQTQAETGMLPMRKQLLQAQIGQAQLREDPARKMQEEVAAREAIAQKLGIDLNSPVGRQWAASGKFPREDQQELSATEKKMVEKADEQLVNMDSTLEALNEASGILENTYEGMGARERAWAKNRLKMGDETSFNTERYGQIMDSEAIQSMSQSLKGATTDFELRKFVELISDPSKPIAVRRKAMDQMMRKAARYREQLIKKSQGIRTGDYFKPQAPAAGPTHVFDPVTGKLKPVGGQ